MESTENFRLWNPQSPPHANSEAEETKQSSTSVPEGEIEGFFFCCLAFVRVKIRVRIRVIVSRRKNGQS
jgi:hypothetical protein